MRRPQAIAARHSIAAIFSGTLLLATLALLLPPIYSYWTAPSYRWGFSSPGFLQGGLAALVLLALFAGTAIIRLGRAWRIVLLVVSSFFYLRLADADLSFLFGLLWLEGMLAVGGLVPAHGLRLDGGLLFSLRLTLGICLWMSGLLVLSLLHVATPIGLLIYSIVLFLSAGLIRRKQPFIFRAFRYLVSNDPAIAFGSGYLLLMILVIFARAFAVVDFDSIWYGLRSEWVLAPDGSIFDRLGLVGQVFYYPKLFEALVLPASWPGLPCFAYAINGVVYLAIGIISYAIVRAAGVSRRLAILAAALVMSTPTLTTMSLTAKPDLLCSFFLLCGSALLLVAVRRRQILWLVGTLATILLAISTKLSALPFGGLLGIGAVTIALIEIRRRGWIAFRRPKAAWLLVGFIGSVSVLVALAFSLRTYLLTGYPLVGDSSLAAIFDALGFTPRYPAHVRHDVTAFTANPWTVLYDYLFRPTEMPFAGMDWPGNAGVLLFVSGLAAIVLYRARPRWTGAIFAFLPILVSGCVLAACFGSIPGGAGYYFLFPTVLAALAGLAMLAAVSALRPALLAVLSMMMLANATLGFMLSPGLQRPGTGEFSWNLSRSPWETQMAQQQELRSDGMWPIYQFIRHEMPRDCRAVASGQWEAVYDLPCTVEDLTINMNQNPILESSQAFANYLNATGTDLLIVSRFPSSTVMYESATYLHGKGLKMVETPLYLAIDLRPIRGHVELPVGMPDAGQPTTELIGLLSTATPVDANGNPEPTAGQYRLAPNDDLYYTDEQSVLLSAGSGMRFPLVPPPTGHSWRFSATVGMTPEEVMAQTKPSSISVRLLAANGRELLEHFWQVGAGSPISLTLDSPSGSRPYYLEIRCSKVTGGASAILIGSPRITAVPDR